MSKFGDYKVLHKVYVEDIFVDGVVAEVYDELWAHGDTKFTIARGVCDCAKVSPKSVEFFKTKEEAMEVLNKEEEVRKKVQEKNKLLVVLNSGKPSWKIMGNVKEANNYLIITNASVFNGTSLDGNDFIPDLENSVQSVTFRKVPNKIVIPKQSVAFTVVLQ
jgi:hypothetical protein